MNGKMLDDLEQSIQKCLDKHCEGMRWPSFYCPPGISKSMAKAAEAVFDCSVETSQYQDREIGSNSLVS